MKLHYHYIGIISQLVAKMSFLSKLMLD